VRELYLEFGDLEMMRDTRCGIRDSRFGMRDAGYEIENIRCGPGMRECLIIDYVNLGDGAFRLMMHQGTLNFRL
jgi:hypothetical protein